MTPAALRRLTSLAEARWTRDLARLDTLLRQDRQLQDDIAVLAGTLERDMAAGIDLPPAQLALRQAWVDQGIRAAHRERASLAGGIAVARASAIQSLGKHRALEKLVDRGEEEARHLRQTRAEREAPPPALRGELSPEVGPPALGPTSLNPTPLSPPRS